MKIDLTGQKFGAWTVLNPSDKVYHTGRRVFWVCRCECGTLKEVFTHSLRSGDSTSCGCYDFPTRFRQSIQIAPNDCWNWTGFRNPKGYGRVGVKGKLILAHRYVYQQSHGPIPTGLCVCHKCDNPSCVNPDHLFLGTNYVNVRDRWTKDRCNHPKGEKSGNSKLDEIAVRDILENCQPRISGRSMAFYASKYSVSDSLIEFIIKRKAWKHVAV